MNECEGQGNVELSQVFEHLARLDSTIESNKSLVSELEQRLQDVLRYEAETNDCDNKDRPQLVPLAERLCESYEDLDKSNILLRDILGRLEL